MAEAPPEFRELIGKRVGDFVLSAVLGQGGMGVVLLAEHPALGKQVAVKFLNRMLASMPEMSARFLKEARSAASLQHPNIVDILDFGEID
jgi:serine/threonine-protein kinase